MTPASETVASTGEPTPVEPAAGTEPAPVAHAESTPGARDGEAGLQARERDLLHTRRDALANARRVLVGALPAGG